MGTPVTRTVREVGAAPDEVMVASEVEVKRENVLWSVTREDCSSFVLFFLTRVFEF